MVGWGLVGVLNVLFTFPLTFRHTRTVLRSGKKELYVSERYW